MIQYVLQYKCIKILAKKSSEKAKFLFSFLPSQFIYPDDEIDPEEVDEDESASLGEESPSSKDRMESGSEGIQRAADQSVEEAAEL